MLCELEALKRGVYEAGRLEDVFTIAPELERFRTLHGAALAEAFLTTRKGQPEQTAALIAARRQDEQIARKLCCWVVRKIGDANDADHRKAA